MKPFFLTASRVQIFEDPLTRQRPEGMAELVTCLRDRSQFHYEHSHNLVAEEWYVKFDGEDAAYLRVVTAGTGETR